MTKKCTRCGEEKELEEFGSKKSNADGRDTRCKKCLAELKREWVARPKKEKEVIPDGFHKCSKCGEIKPIETFHKRAKCKDGYSNVCMVCSNKYNDKWKEEHREQHLASRRNNYYKNIDREHARMLSYYRANSIRLCTQNKEWINKNRDRRNAAQRNYFRELAKTDPNFVLTRRFRSATRRILVSGKKASKTMELIGTTVQNFREYFLQQFDEGMSWDRFLNGEIEIDHIRPVSTFDFTNPIDQYICFNYRNHQPLWCMDNRKKSDNWSKTNQILWENTIGKEIKKDLIERGIIDSSYEGC